MIPRGIRKHQARVDARTPARKAELATVARLLEYEFAAEATHAPNWEIAFTLRLRDPKFEPRIYGPDELRRLSARLLTGGPDIPLAIKGAEVALGAFVLKTNYTKSAKDALYRRISLVLTFALDGEAPYEHRASKHFRPSRR